MRIDIATKVFADRQILGKLNFEISRGERVALVGPSGIGKSTLIRVLAGLDTAFQGHIEGSRNTAIVFQEPTLLPWRNALANIMLPTGCDRNLALSLMTEVGLQGRETAYPRQLSLGQQRRLALARALAARPDTLFLDEAFASLDQETSGRMLALTKTLLKDRNITLLLATHDLREAQELCTRIIAISGTPAEIVLDRPIDNDIARIQTDLDALSAS